MWRFRWHLARLAAFLAPGRADAEMSREMASHLVMLEDEYRRRGLSDDAARLAAREKLGTEEWVRDLHRDARVPLWLEQLRQDLRYTLRSLAANRAYAAVCVLTLALGIGANSAVFSVVHPLMIEPLPFDEPGQLVQLLEQGSSSDWTNAGARPYPLPPRRLGELADGLSTVDGMFQAYSLNTTMFDPGDPSGVRLSGVSEGAFATLRAQPLLGRLLETFDHAPGAEPVAVASHAAWQRLWRSDPDALGSRIALDVQSGRTTFRVVGVLPEDFDLAIGAPNDPSADFWVPGDFSGHGTGSGLTTILRVRDGLEVEAASAEVRPRLEAMQMQSYRFDVESGELQIVSAGAGALVSLKERQLERSRAALMILVAIVGMVLLIACLNVASLMLGRMASRRRELAVRSSLGATRWRLVRQVFTESFVLAVAGGMAGAIVAWAALQLLSSWPGNAPVGGAGPFLEMPRIGSLALDRTVLAFTFSVSLLTGLLCGVSPALSVGRDPGISHVKHVSAALASSRFGVRSRSALIVVQVGLAMVLLVCAGLLMNSFLRLASVDPGFATDDVVSFRITASREHFRSTAPFGGGVGYFEDLAEEIGRLPGVDSVGYGPSPFAFGAGNAVAIELPGVAGAAMTNVLDVSDGYLDAIGVPVLQGRGLRATDDAGRPLALLVNGKFVEQHLGGRNPVGMLVATSIGRPPLEGEIVGVVGNIRRGGLSAEPYPQLFVDYRQASAGGNVDYWWAFFAVRTSQPDVIVDNVSRMVRRFDSDARVDGFSSLDELLSDTIAAPRFLGSVFSAFAVAGITLAVIGLYGAMSYFVAQRTSEIGVRMAIGANSKAILSMIVRQSALLTIAGIALGVGAGLTGGRYLRSMLFGIEPTDPATFVAVALSFFVVAMLAAWVPARRATRISPVAALKHE